MAMNQHAGVQTPTYSVRGGDVLELGSRDRRSGHVIAGEKVSVIL